MSTLEEMLEMFATTVQAELNTTLHICKSGLQDVLTNRSNFTSNVFSSSCMVRGALKGKPYAKKPRTIQELENSTRNTFFYAVLNPV
jgi:hypothetical protein